MRRFAVHHSVLLGLFLAAALVPVPRPVYGATAADYRREADAAVAQRQYASAAHYYQLEAGVYRQKGDLNAAKVEEMKADRWATSVALYADLPADAGFLAARWTHAKAEPVYGCYIGAYVVSDDRLGDAGPGDREEAFSRLVVKRLATFFDYCRYGEVFPTRWAQALADRGIAPHIAWEPNDGMEQVQDDDYLEQFARDAAACRVPVFLRFAGEMNGDWTVYHRDPALYRQKFRLVHDVMARLAPNVVMIWCVNHIPEPNMDSYYPGDDAVDWVGVNFYSVLHHDNDPTRPAAFENPASMLEYVYQKYAARKPIAICEYGASHREQLEPGVDRSDVAETKLAELFAELPRRFPRVKLVDIFDCDNMEHARAGRQFNDYSVTDSPGVQAAFTRAVTPSYYLSQVIQNGRQEVPSAIQPLQPEAVLSGVVPLSASIQTYDEHPTVVYAIDGSTVAKLTGPGDDAFNLDTSRYPTGHHTISLEVYDSQGQRVGGQTVEVVFRRAPVRATPPPVRRVAAQPTHRPIRPAAAGPTAPEIPPPTLSPPELAALAGVTLLFLVLALRLAFRKPNRRR